MSYYEERDCPNGWTAKNGCLTQASASFQHRCETGDCPYRIKHYHGGVEIMEVAGVTVCTDPDIPHVNVINICALMEHLWPGYFDGKTNPGFDETGEAIMKWAEENDAYIYSRPREDFFMFEAIDLALAAGKAAVVVEDMS